MKNKTYRIHIKKESLKFAAAHTTVFPNGTKEALHGHNYQVGFMVETKNAALKDMVDFAVYKDVMNRLCMDWDEKVLIAADCPFMKINSKDKQSIDFTLCKKRYVLPADEVVMVPVDNITAELLAEELCNLFVKGIKADKMKGLTRITVRVDESNGQGSAFTWER